MMLTLSIKRLVIIILLLVCTLLISILSTNNDGNISEYNNESKEHELQEVLVTGYNLDFPTSSFGEVAGTYYYHNDHLGTPQVMTDSSSTVVWRANYTPFGKADIVVEMVTNNIRFPGQYYDQESGLHYNYFRDYYPELGRYIQSDPIGLSGGINTYGYVGGNPVSYYDIYGLAKSGQTTKIPGTNATVRIDNPHVPGQQKHAHIKIKGAPGTVVNKDGTGRHGTDMKKITKNKKILDFLRKKGFKLGVYGLLPFYSPKEAFCIVNPGSCTKQPECI